MSKILMVTTDRGYGGAPKIFASIANSLSKKHQIEIFDFGGNFAFHDFCSEITITKPFTVDSRRKLLKSILFTRKYLRSNNLDFIVGFDFYSRMISSLSSIFTKTRSIVSERNDPNSYRLFSRITNRLIYRLSNTIVFQSDQARNYFSRTIIKKSKVIPNFIDTSNINIKKNQANNIIYIGRLAIKQKATDKLIKAFKEISCEFGSTMLYIFGDGPDLQILLKLVSDLDLQDKVFFMGVSNDLDYIYSFGSIFVMTSRYEGMPNSLMEAMLYSKAIVTTDFSPGSAKSLITNGENGIIVEVNDIRSISQSCITLLGNLDLISKLGKNANDTIKKFDTKLVIPSWEKLFD
jgi:glycosyltransferase involved in cell wall biosynthesis